MRVRFVLGNDTVADSPYDFMSSKKQGFNYYMRLKTIEFLPLFKNSIVKLRQKDGLPKEGLGAEALIEARRKKRLDSGVAWIDSSYERDGLMSLSKGFSSILNFQDFFGDNYINRSSLGEIYVFGAVQVNEGLPQIRWFTEDLRHNDQVTTVVNISIAANISKNQLQKYIEKHFDSQIKPILEDEVKKEDNLHISKRDLRILCLREHEKKTWWEIAEILTEETGIGRDEDEVRVAGNRALKRIRRAAGPRF